jgi:Tfp pilus assembly protein PilN
MVIKVTPAVCVLLFFVIRLLLIASTVNILQEAYTYIKQLEETTENRNGRIMALKEQQTTLMARLKSHYEAGKANNAS